MPAVKPPFLYRGRVFTRALLDSIPPKMWGWVTERQDYEGSAHVDTETIMLRGPAGEDVDRPFDCIETSSWWAADVLGARGAYWDVLDQLREIVPHTALGRVMLVRLKPGGWVRPHVDEGAYAEHYTTRLHVAMTETPRAYLRVGGQVQTFDQHECWSFNHRMLHEARNCDTVPRVHLIADVVEENDDDRREREQDDARNRDLRAGDYWLRADA
jgi:hypothetical protein